MDDRIDHAARQKAYEAYAEQEAWMMHCGRDREGYRRIYIDPASADAIYEADLAALQALYDEYRGTSDYGKALRVLGEEYFA